MIDLDRMEEQLDGALTVRPARSRPAMAAAPVQSARPVAGPRPGADLRELLELGRMDDVDAVIRMTVDRRDLVTWTTLRALLDGRSEAVVIGVADLLGLAQATQDPETWSRYWAQRFWAAVEWGTDDERRDVLDHCRERAYRFDEIEWWGRLAVLAATMGKGDEAERAFDDARTLLDRAAHDARWLDALTDLVDAMALVGDWGRIAQVSRLLPEGGLVVVGAGVVCKGSVERYRALGHLATGDRTRAARAFDTAAATHQALGAAPLLARTRAQARILATAA